MHYQIPESSGRFGSNNNQINLFNPTNMNNLINKEMVIRLKNGDKNSFNYIYRMLYTSLLKFSLKHLQSEQDAEDITQGLFLKIWEQRNKINEELNFKSYLFKIAKNDICNVFKKRTYGVRYCNHVIESGIHKEATLHTEERYEYRDELNLVSKLIDEFPPKQKLIFRLNKIDGYSQNEIASMLDLSVRTIENNVFRSMKRLRPYTVFSKN
jgi:RNA polymerase sigma-70 factor (family 1)